MKIEEQINSHEGLFVKVVAQIAEQELIVFFSQARVDYVKSSEMKFNQGTEHEFALTNMHPVVSDDACKKYRAKFNRVLIYEVVEEACIAWDDTEAFEGGLFRTFTKSRFLDHIDSHLIVDWYRDIPEMSYHHYQIAGLDSIVNVASQDYPLLEEVNEFKVQ